MTARPPRRRRALLRDWQPQRLLYLVDTQHIRDNSVVRIRVLAHLSSGDATIVHNGIDMSRNCTACNASTSNTSVQAQLNLTLKDTRMLAVILLHFSNFDSAHDDVESVWFELWVNGRLW